MMDFKRRTSKPFLEFRGQNSVSQLLPFIEGNGTRSAVSMEDKCLKIVAPHTVDEDFVERPSVDTNSNEADCSYTLTKGEGYTVVLKLCKGGWQAEVQDNRFSGFSHRYLATVRLGKGYSIKNLVTLPPFHQSRYIHFIGKEVFIGSVSLKGGSLLNWLGLESCRAAFCFESEWRCTCGYKCTGILCQECCDKYCHCHSKHKCAGTCGGNLCSLYKCKNRRCFSTLYCNRCCGCYERERQAEILRKERARKAAEAAAAAERVKAEEKKRQIQEQWNQEQERIKKQQEKEEQERLQKEKEKKEQIRKEREEIEKAREQLRKEREQLEKEKALHSKRMKIFDKLDTCLASTALNEEELYQDLHKESIAGQTRLEDTFVHVYAEDVGVDPLSPVHNDSSDNLERTTILSTDSFLSCDTDNNDTDDDNNDTDEESTSDETSYFDQESSSYDSDAYESAASDVDVEAGPDLLRTRSFLDYYSSDLSSEERHSFYEAFGKFFEKKLPLVDEALQLSVIDYFTNQGWQLYPSVVQHYQVPEWIVQSLLRDVAYDSERGDSALSNFRTQWLKISNSSTFDQETLLKSLRLKKKMENLSVLDIGRVLEFILETGPSGYAIVCSNAPRWLYNLKLAWLQPQLASHSNFSASEQNDLGQVLADMDWGVGMLEGFLNSIKDEVAVEPILELLEVIQQNHIPDFLVQPIITTVPTQSTRNKAKQWAHTMKHRVLLLKINVSREVSQSLEQPLYNLLQSCSLEFLERVIREHKDLLNSFTADFIKVLELLFDYRLSELNCASVFSDLRAISSTGNWVAKIDQNISSELFIKSEITPSDLLIQNVAASSNLSEEKLKSDYGAIVKAYHSVPVVLPDSEKICDWVSVESAELWAEQVKSEYELLNSAHVLHDPVPQSELIAGVQRAAELSQVRRRETFSVRETQLLSLLTLLNPVEGMGRLAQINTGEGKSLIVAMLAAILALQGRKVDVITASTELSIPEVKKQKPFFKSLLLSVAENSKKESKLETYKCDVVYGISSDFQADILRTEFLGIDVRGCRGFDVVIVDEVDSMLFDNRSHSVRLSEQLPGMMHLELPLAAAWVQMKLALEHVRDIKSDPTAAHIEDEAAFITDKVQDHLRQILRDLNAEEKAEYEEFKTLEYQITTLENEIANATGTEEKKEKTAICESQKKKLATLPWSERYAVFNIPLHLREFAKSQVPYWTKNALIAAYTYKKDAHYTELDNRIVPIHFNETGVLQSNMVWSDGLTQFLQLKEGLPIDPEGVSTNINSNVGYFQRYNHSIYGVTGTLGEESTKDFLLRIYKTETVIIPPHMRTKIRDNEDSCYACKELAPIVLSNEDKWYKTIIDRAVNHAELKRAVLIICKFIIQVNYLNVQLKEKYKAEKVFSYTGESEFKKHKIDEGEIIIATNIAGRGTDLETTSSVESHGGMYVAITFLPESLRVELQNVGRTARSGKKGMAQLIICDRVRSDMQDIKKNRNEQERLACKRAIQDAKKMLLQDRLFKEFRRLEEQLVPTANVCHQKKKWAEWESHKAETLSPAKIAEHVNKARSNRILFLKQTLLGNLTYAEAGMLTESDELYYMSKVVHKAASECPRLEMQYKKKVIDDFCRQPDLPESLITCIKDESEFIPVCSDLAKKYDWGWYERKAFEEHWGFWLKGQHFEQEDITEEEALERFDREFVIPAHNRAQEGELIYNPYFYVQKGNRHLHLTMHSPDDRKLAAAIACYNKAINIDPDFSVNALYNKALALLLHQKNHEDCQKQALEALKKAKQLIGTYYRPDLLTFSTLIAQYGPKIKTSEHAQHQLNLIGQQENYIDKACLVIEKALSEKLNVKLTTKLISETLHAEDADHHSKAIEEASVNGFTHLFEVKSIRPIRWDSILSLSLISLAQITGGCLITIYTMGAAGPMLILEGIYDMINAIKLVTADSFDWADWAVQKGISLAISVVTFGNRAIKAGVRDVRGVSREFFGVRGATSVRNGVKAAAMDVCAGLGKGALNEMTSLTAEWGANKLIIEKWAKRFVKEVEEQIIVVLRENPSAKKALELDVADGTNHWQDLFLEEGFLLLQEKKILKNEMKAVCKYMVHQIQQGVENTIDKQEDFISKMMSKVLSIATQKDMNPVHKYTEKFLRNFTARIEAHKSDIKDAILPEKVKSIAKAADLSTTSEETINLIAPPHDLGVLDFTIDMDDQARSSNNTHKIEKSYRPQGTSNPQTIAAALAEQISNSISNSIMCDFIKPVINMGTSSLTNKVFQGVDDIVIDFKRKAIAEQISATKEKSNQVKNNLTVVGWGQTRPGKRQEKEDIPSVDSHKEEKVELNKHTLRALKRLRNKKTVTVADLTLACSILDTPCELYDERGNLLETLGKGLARDTIKLKYKKENGVEHYEPLNPKVQMTPSGEHNSALDAMLMHLSPDEKKKFSLKDGEGLRKLLEKHICDDPELPNRAFETQYKLARLLPDGFTSGEEGWLPAEIIKCLMAVDEASPCLKHFIQDCVKLARAAGLMAEIRDAVNDIPYLMAGVMFLSNLAHDCYDRLIEEGVIDMPRVKEELADYVQEHIDPHFDRKQALWAAMAIINVVDFFKEQAPNSTIIDKLRKCNEVCKKPRTVWEELPGTGNVTEKSEIISPEGTNENVISNVTAIAVEAFKTVDRLANFTGKCKQIKNVTNTLKNIKNWFK